MLEYGWGNVASIIFSGGGGDAAQDTTDQSRHEIFDPFNQTLAGNLLPPVDAFPFSLQHHSQFQHHHHHHHLQQQSQAEAIFQFQQRPTISSSTAPADGFLQHSPFHSMEQRDHVEHDPVINGDHHQARIGLNLGVRTYFSSADEVFVNRLYRRPRPVEPVNPPRCQAEGCTADLSSAMKEYHRRHKVCAFHSKAATVVVNGLTQRFCQQCSRFQLLSEFDQGKRSCRKRLEDHNRRRRKSQLQPQLEIKP